MQALWADFAKAAPSRLWPPTEGPRHVVLDLDVGPRFGHISSFGSTESLQRGGTVNCDFWDTVTEGYGLL
ncbi:hypothetical protein AK812_SmicGene45392 [Symbiodinium microadriaticum]|uniref:Uncharacterized protein n=1 Tax=Symbiodinium microadriaticum TaxID=2951 RepID=A0A1Q9BWF1_SYMMI|nr:hypothetical protein AK812_SmicGene45392 [Symbiodinium microadriaticum]CAE7946149.1 unnamed protein product [Symbiodinium sp. KB8]